MPDKRALKILFDRYWSAAGWRLGAQQVTSEADFAYAKQAGVMFDPVRLDHSEIWDRLLRARDAVTARVVASAFVSSLSSRRLELRSALGSYAVFRHAAAHTPIEREGRCDACGLYLLPADEDLNVLNFERFKWGGVRHDDPIYAAFDLERFASESVPSLAPEDVGRLRATLAAIEAAPEETTSANLHSVLGRVIKGNKAERDQVVEILGLCGVLETAEHRGYRERFVPWRKRELPSRRFVDMRYPACWWRRPDGVNQQAVQDWFGYLL